MGQPASLTDEARNASMAGVQRADPSYGALNAAQEIANGIHAQLGPMVGNLFPVRTVIEMARLIDSKTRAPDMLWALQQIARYADTSTDPGIVNVVRAAISAAVGDRTDVAQTRV